MKTLFRYFIISLVFTLVITAAVAQPTKVRGKITDAATNEPIPFVSVVFKGTLEGASSDFEGNYFLETRTEVDSVEISFLGYKMQTLPVNKHGFKTIDVALQEDVAMLGEVVIVADKKRENPAHRIVRGIIKNKKRNNPEKANTYEYDAYSKTEVSLTNINDKFKNKKLLKKFQFVFDYVDTSAVTGKAYLPFMILESKSKVLNTVNPKSQKEIIEASKISGFSGDNTSILQFTGQLYQDFNVYDNYINIFQQGFISPFNSNGLLFYKYYLTDSIQKNDKKLYHLSFQPKNEKTVAFRGDFWVQDEEFAVTEITMRVNHKVNVNWVNDVMISEKFAKKADSVWFWENREMLVDFSLSKGDSLKQKGFLARKNTHYDNVQFNPVVDKRFEEGNSNTIVQDDALQKDDAYWDNARPYELSKSEKGVYSMVDSIKNVPLYRTIVDVMSTVFTGYYDFGKFEIGPYYKLASHNDVEGIRLQFGGRTTSALNNKVRFGAYLAYGIKDKEFKYKGDILYRFNEKMDLWSASGISYKHDMEQLGKGSSVFLSAGNILATALSRGATDKITLEDELKAYWEKEWWTNFMTTVSARYRKLTPSVYVPYTPANGAIGDIGEDITTQELALRLRWTPGKRVVRRSFKTKRVEGHLPSLQLDFTSGFGDYTYQKVDFTVEHRVPVYPIGHTYYFAKAGKIFGEVPFPLLHLHEGNETYVYDPYAYNLMDYYEFASDTYASLSAEHHFMGFFMNKIPLLRKLNWRTVVTGKTLWGSLRDENKGVNRSVGTQVLFPKGLTDLDKPYFEASVGIENIFKVARVDAVWRLSHLDDNREKFGIRATLQLTF